MNEYSDIFISLLTYALSLRETVFSPIKVVDETVSGLESEDLVLSLTWDQSLLSADVESETYQFEKDWVC